MIGADVRNQIKRLVGLGRYTHRQIARRLDVSKSSVSSIARGAREARLPPDPFLTAGEQRVHPPVRCPGCGGRIEVVPCRACRLGPGAAGG